MKEKITLEQVAQITSDYKLIVYAAPFMIIVALLEMYFSNREKKNFYNGKDFLASLSIGLFQVLQSALLKTITFALVIWCYNISPLAIPINALSFIACFIILDFIRYYAHRIGHETNLFWATHVTHHNSEKYNLSTGFRLSWTQHIKIIFFLPISLMGFHPLVFFICHQVAVLYQYWIHTEYIHKMPAWFRYIFVTPSHHRVHHGRDEKYLDKNFGSTFIIWDRMLGTFQPEEERPTYGVINQPKGYNPITLNFHVWQDIVRNMRKAPNLKSALLILIQPPSKLKE